jgi:cytoskeletal protein RodZ
MLVTESDAARGADQAAWVISIHVGEALWRGRLRAGLSLDDVAGRIGVDPETVGALESSDFARLPSRDGAIAAARTYAQLVGLSKKWVTAALDKELLRHNG